MRILGVQDPGESGSKARSETPPRARPRRRARVRRSAARLWKLSLLVAVASLVAAASASADTVFSDGFESGDFSAWSLAQTAGDGTAAVQSTTVSTGSFAAQLAESSTAGSKAYVRKTLDSSQQDLSASGDFRVLQQGASGGNVPFFRFLDPTSARVVSVYRQNVTASKNIFVSYGGSFFQTTGSLPLDTWGKIELHVITNGAGGSTVEVRLNGTLIYQTTSASLGTAGVSTVQIGNDAGAQAFELLADTIDVHTPPETTIDSGPSGLTNNASPSFAFSSSDAGSSFECRIDSSQAVDWQPCSSPKSYGPLADGPHTFEVRATDQAYNTDQSPASSSFTVDTAPPETTIDSGPSGLTNNPTPSFAFHSSEPGASFECKLDSGSYSACSSPKTTNARSPTVPTPSGSGPGRGRERRPPPGPAQVHRRHHAARDDDRLRPLGDDQRPHPDLRISSSKAGSTFQCKLDSGPYRPAARRRPPRTSRTAPIPSPSGPPDRHRRPDAGPARVHLRTSAAPRLGQRLGLGPRGRRPRPERRTTWRSPGPPPRSCGSPTSPAAPTRARASTREPAAPEAATTPPTAPPPGSPRCSRCWSPPPIKTDKVVNSSGLPSSLYGGAGRRPLIGGAAGRHPERGSGRRRASGDGRKRPAAGPRRSLRSRRSTAAPGATRPTSTCSPWTPTSRAARPRRGTREAGASASDGEHTMVEVGPVPSRRCDPGQANL